MTENEKVLCDLLNEILLQPHKAIDPDWARRAMAAIAMTAIEDASCPKDGGTHE